MIQIVCIATDYYKKYFERFLESLKYFFPNEDKILTLLTDDVEIAQKYPCGDKIKIEPIFFPHLYYPTINLNKPIIFNGVLAHDAKYAFIFDINTIFIRKDNSLWDRLKTIMDDNNVLLTKHPFYSLPDVILSWNRTRKELLSDLYSTIFTEKDKRFSSFIPDEEYTYIITSFWGGKTDSVELFNNAISKLIRKDLTRYPNGWHIPNFMDENYINKAYWQQEKKDISIGVGMYVDTFNILGGFDENKTADTVFMLQKNM